MKEGKEGFYYISFEVYILDTGSFRRKVLPRDSARRNLPPADLIFSNANIASLLSTTNILSPSIISLSWMQRMRGTSRIGSAWDLMPESSRPYFDSIHVPFSRLNDKTSLH
jgi:hypothetical protein